MSDMIMGRDSTAPQSPPIINRRRRRGRLAIRIAMALLISLLWFKTVRLAILVIDLNTRVNALKQEALTLSASPDIPGSLKHVRSGVDDIRALVGDIRATVWPFEGPLKGMGWLPIVGPNIAAVPHLLEIGDSLLAAAHGLDVAYSPFVEKVLGSGQASGSALDLLVEVAQVEGQALADARVNVDAALSARRQIADTRKLHPKLQSVLEDVDKILDLVDKGLWAAQAAPDLLGVDRPQHVLVLIENADELRATGGFITASAYVVIDRGQLGTPVVMSSNSPQIDRNDLFQYEVPPPPQFKYMHLQRWYFRDANWWSDFPTSAAKAAGLYSAGLGVPVDTVVAINQYTLRDLIGVVGPITLDDGSVITQENAIESLQGLWAQSLTEKGPEGRKAFIQSLAPLLISKLMGSRDMGTLTRAWDAQKTIGLRHDLLIYSTDSRIQALSEGIGLDGSISAEKGDYLYILDTNIGWNKADLVMQRKLTYYIDLANLAIPLAQLKMTYRNPSLGQFIGPACISGERYPPAYPERADDCYADFIRLYVPNGTQLMTSPTFKYPDSYVGLPDEEASRFIQMPGEGNKAIFGALMVVPTQRQRVLSFTYTLPAREIFDATPGGELVYNLTVPKQPGRQAFPVTISVDLPEDVPASSITPEPTSRDGRTLTFQLNADADIHIRIVFSAGVGLIQQLGISIGSGETAQPPRVVPTSLPLPTALPVTATPLPTPTVTPMPTNVAP